MSYWNMDRDENSANGLEKVYWGKTINCFVDRKRDFVKHLLSRKRFVLVLRLVAGMVSAVLRQVICSIVHDLGSAVNWKPPGCCAWADMMT